MFWIVAAIPLLPLLTYAARGGRKDLAWISGALAVSAFASTVQNVQVPDPNWVVVTLYPLAQYAMLSPVLTTGKPFRLWSMAVVAITTTAVLVSGVGTLPNVIVLAVVAPLVTALVSERRDLGLARWGLILFFGFSFPGLFAMSLTSIQETYPLSAYAAYTVPMAAGSVLCAAEIIAQTQRPQVRRV